MVPLPEFRSLDVPQSCHVSVSLRKSLFQAVGIASPGGSRGTWVAATHGSPGPGCLG